MLDLKKEQLDMRAYSRKILESSCPFFILNSSAFLDQLKSLFRKKAFETPKSKQLIKRNRLVANI